MDSRSSSPNTTSTSSTTKKARSKYSRPCDSCSVRKVRCDLQTPCSRCIKHNLPCTNNRVRKKCGPKNIHQKTRDAISQVSRISSTSTPTPIRSPILVNPTTDGFEFKIPVESLLPCLQIYQTWYYGVWPVISVAQLVSILMNKSPSSDCDSETLSTYSLSCALSAATINQVRFLKSNFHLFYLPEQVQNLDFAQECFRARDEFDYRSNPSLETCLTCFFLYAYYVNTIGGKTKAIIHLRESISIAQILGLHNPASFINKSPAEVHRMKKVYYLLLVTERYVCIEDSIPVILEPTIPLPSLNDEEYSVLISGFRELVKIFAIPDRTFFDRFIALKSNMGEPNSMMMPTTTFHSS